MIGLLVELLLSWLLLWFFERQNPLILGISPTKTRLFQFIGGFGVAAAICAIYFYLQTIFSETHWSLNENFSFLNGLSGFWWTLKSVLFEELIFRGALLYIAIKTIGLRRACMLSAIAFGIYHWFSFNAFGNPAQMIFVFLLTGIWGLMFAYAFAITKSLFLPIGLHLGWNLMNIVVFSQGPLGDQFLISSGGVAINTLASIGIMVFQIVGLPLIVYFLLRRIK